MSDKKKAMPIFRGNGSREMWGLINNAKTIRDLKEALYSVCCHLQTLEHRWEQSARPGGDLLKKIIDHLDTLLTDACSSIVDEDSKEISRKAYAEIRKLLKETP